MFRIAKVIIISVFFSSCNYSTDKSNNQTELKEVELKEKKLTCFLNVDTFSFKGIKINDDIFNLKKKYNLKKLPNIKLQRKELQYSLDWDTIIIPDFPEVKKYEIKPLKNLTIFGHDISTLTISTYKNKVYNIIITTLENEDDFNFTKTMSNLAEKYNATGCIKYIEEDTKMAIMGDLNLSNSKLSIHAYITNSNIQYYKSTLLESEVLKTKNKSIKYKLQCTIIVTDLISSKSIDKAQKKLDLEQEKKKKEDF